MPDYSDHYIPVGKDQPREPLASKHFILQSLLSSRVETGMSDEVLPDEEDVNVYLTHLLCGWIDPRQHQYMAGYVQAFSHETFERVQYSTSSRFKYTVYRANADRLLMLLGIFDNAPQGRPTSNALEIPKKSHMGRAKAYYDFASTYSRIIFGTGSAVPSVLGKLANNFEEYVRLLSHVRSEHLNLIAHLSDGVLYHLHEEVNAKMVAVSYDSFLDALVVWRDNPSEKTRQGLQHIVDELQKLDSNFHWEWPEAQ